MYKDFTELKIFNIESGKEGEGWNFLKNNCPDLSQWGLERFRSGLDGHVGCIILEPNYICKDHRNLYSHFYSKKFIRSTPITNRLHFFSSHIESIKELLLNYEKYQDQYLGYSVIRPIKERCIGRTVIDPFKIGKGTGQNYYCLTTKFKIHIYGAKFFVEGFPYTSQDADVTVCAHSALWGICRYLSERYSLYKEVYPFDFVRMTGTNLGRTFPYRGMSYSDYSSILSEFGVYPVILRLKKNPEEKNVLQHELIKLYTYVESGFPILASFAGHVVSLIGHTLDLSRTYSPNADGFIDSFVFLNQFVTVDDNYFPYVLLGNECDPNNYASSYPNGGYSINSIVNAVCPLPGKAFLPAEKAKRIALMYLHKGFKEELKKFSQSPWVTRFFITTNASFKKRKLDLIKIGLDKLGSFIINIDLPHFIWVMEISSIDQYRKGECVAEIILDSTANERDDAIIYIRIGNKLYFGGKEKAISDAPQQFLQYIYNLKRG